MKTAALPGLLARTALILAVSFAALIALSSPAEAGVGDVGGGGGGGGTTTGGNQPSYSCTVSTVTAQWHFGVRTERYAQGFFSGGLQYQMPFWGQGSNCPGGKHQGWAMCPSGMDVWRFYATGSGTSYQVRYFSASQSNSQVYCDPRSQSVVRSGGDFRVDSFLKTLYTYPSPDDAGTAGRPFRYFQNATWNAGPSMTSGLGIAPNMLVPNRPHFSTGSTSGLASSPNLVAEMLRNPSSRDAASRSVYDLYMKYRDEYGPSLAAAHANLSGPPGSPADIPGLYNAGQTAFASPFDLARDPDDRTQVLYGVCYQPREVPSRVFLLSGVLRTSAYAFNPSRPGQTNAARQRYVPQGTANDAAARARYGNAVVDDVRNRIQSEVAGRDPRGATGVGRSFTLNEWSRITGTGLTAVPAVNQAEAAVQARQQAVCMFGVTRSDAGGDELLTPQIPVRGNIGVVAPDSFTVQGTFGEGVIRTSISTSPDCGRMPCSPAPDLVSVRFNPRLVSSDPARYEVCAGTYREGCGAVVTSTRTLRTVRGVPVEVEIRAQFYNATPNGVTLRIDTSDAQTVWQPYQIRRVCTPFVDLEVIEGDRLLFREVTRQHCEDIVIPLRRVTLAPGTGLVVSGNEPRLVVRSIVTR
jgi:hypothetical protein